MADFNMFSVDADIISTIFFFILHDLDNFSMFGKFLMAYFKKSTAAQVKHVLQKLNWDVLYQYHNHFLEVRRDQFHGFIRFAVQMEVEQDMFYNSVRMLFLRQNVDHNLLVLSMLSGSHFPSSFAFIFFRAIYRPLEIDESVNQMTEILSVNILQSKFLDIMKLLEEMYCYISDIDYLLPVYKLCPHARNRNSFHRDEGHSNGDDLWHSLCDMTVEDNSNIEDYVYGKRLTMSHLWNTNCGHCKLQLILFKILLSVVYD